MDSAQLVYQKVQGLPFQQVQQVLDFIESLQNNLKSKAPKKAVEVQPTIEQLPISHYAGMIKLPKTNQPRSLFDFDPASIATDD